MLKTADMTCTYLLKRVILKTWSRPGDQALQYPDNNWKWLTFIYETHERRQGPIAGQTIMVICACACNVHLANLDMKIDCSVHLH